ncbi:MAG: transporter [Actinomycetia bacterium]|jgi:predicted MFS family arabinose efflux permease|nr:transporter [Actinomycetes bacterium]
MVKNVASDLAEPGLGSARVGLIILSLSAFAAVTTEMVPVGLLPAIGHTFGVAESTTGLLVSLYAVLVAALAVPLTLATKRIPGKRLLIVAMSCYAVSNVISALAPSLAVLAVGRAVGGVTHALFFSVFIGYVTRLVPPAMTGRAFAVASAGVPAGFVLGVPLATALGNAAGWRAAFAVLAALMVVVLVLVAVMLPDVRSQVDERRPAPGRLRQMATVIGSNTLALLGHYTLYTYVSVLLLRSGASPNMVGPILLVFGIFGLIGVWSAGRRLDRHLRSTALVILAILGAGIAGAGAAVPVLALVIVAGAAWNGAFGAVPTLYQTAAVRAQATSPELAGAWINASSNAGIAAGAALGGVVLGSTGIREVAWLAAAFVIIAILIVLLTRRAFPKAP